MRNFAGLLLILFFTSFVFAQKIDPYHPPLKSPGDVAKRIDNVFEKRIYPQNPNKGAYQHQRNPAQKRITPVPNQRHYSPPQHFRSYTTYYRYGYNRNYYPRHYNNYGYSGWNQYWDCYRSPVVISVWVGGYWAYDFYYGYYWVPGHYEYRYQY